MKSTYKKEKVQLLPSRYEENDKLLADPHIKMQRKVKTDPYPDLSGHISKVFFIHGAHLNPWSRKLFGYWNKFRPLGRIILLDRSVRKRKSEGQRSTLGVGVRRRGRRHRPRGGALPPFASPQLARAPTRKVLPLPRRDRRHSSPSTHVRDGNQELVGAGLVTRGSDMWAKRRMVCTALEVFFGWWPGPRPACSWSPPASFRRENAAT